MVNKKMVATQASIFLFFFARANGSRPKFYLIYFTFGLCGWQLEDERLDAFRTSKARCFLLGHNADSCWGCGFRGKGKNLPVAFDAFADCLVIFRVVDDRDESLLNNAGLHLFQMLVGVREMNEEHLEFVSFGVGLGAFIYLGDDVVIKNVVEYLLDLLGGAGSASVADE